MVSITLHDADQAHDEPEHILAVDNARGLRCAMRYQDGSGHLEHRTD
jgi:hypothetical protein